MVRLVGEGGPPKRRGHEPGDLYLNIVIKEHELFERDGLDVHLEVPLTLSQALLGGKITVPTLGAPAEVVVRFFFNNCDGSIKSTNAVS